MVDIFIDPKAVCMSMFSLWDSNPNSNQMKRSQPFATAGSQLQSAKEKENSNNNINHGNKKNKSLTWCWWHILLHLSAAPGRFHQTGTLTGFWRWFGPCSLQTLNQMKAIMLIFTKTKTKDLKPQIYRTLCIFCYINAPIFQSCTQPLKCKSYEQLIWSN